MKIIRNAVTEANPDLRGRKHHFTIEGATAAELEAMDEILELAGWENDTCPCYEDGFGCGYWIDLSEVDCFKAAYKAAKAGLKGYMAIEAARKEEAAQAKAETVEAIAEKAGVFSFWERNDRAPCRELVNNLEYHYVTALNDEHAGGDRATAAQRLFGFNTGDTLADVFRAVVGQAEEDLAIIVEAAHLEALVMDVERTLNAVDEARAEIDARRVQDVEAAHAEALTIDAEIDAIVSYAGEAAPVQLDGDMNWIFNAAVSVWERNAAAVARVPAADLSAYPIRELHTAIDAEDGKPYAQRPVTRGYIARSISRALESQQRHAEKYTAQDVRWLAEHNADHAFRNSVITAEEFTELYHMIRAENARPLAILAAIRDALLTGAPVMPAARAA
ncbi:TPA: DUF5417 domain-containing protein [Enterobacter hormaechei subsp. steigerwaltii]|nr:DUF5417 domain-containing protein [Enterobacter hormaechei subsp. steigerwaltii]